MMAEFDGVVDQIIKYLLNTLAVGSDEHFFAGKRQRNSNILASTRAFKGCGGVTDDLIDIEIRQIQYHTAGV